MGIHMSTEHRRDPDSVENQEGHMQALRAVFAAQMQYRVEQGLCGPSIERVGHPSESDTVFCPGCWEVVSPNDIKDGKCPECPEEDE